MFPLTASSRRRQRDLKTSTRRDRRKNRVRSNVDFGRSMLLERLEERVVLTGTWSAVANTIPGNNGVGTMLLLSDGTIMVTDGNDNDSKNWYKLTPDSSGSYANGTWTTLAQMHQTRLFFASAVLPDGRVFVAGGEYSNAGSDTNTGEIYDPAANTWTAIASAPSALGDADSEVLPDGNVLVSNLNSSSTYIYHPITNTWTTGASLLNGDTSSEESWVKLSDGSILTYSIQGSGPQRGQRLVLDPNNNHANDQWYDAGAVPVRLDSNGGNSGIVPENGPAVRLSDGRVLYTGASGHTAIYTPPATLTGTGSWAAGPDMKNSSNQLVGAFDAPAGVEINGKVLVVTSPIDGNNFPGPATIQEYNPANNTMTIVPNTNGPNLGDPAFIFRMLALPNGQILVSDATNGLKLYSPDSGQVGGVAPNITDIKYTGGTSFTLQGTQLNGFSEGAAYGDDAQMASNYPIVTLFDPSGHVYYARTSNWSNVGVGTGSTPETVNFTLPAGLAAGEYGLQVSASGVKSKTVLLIVGGSGNDTVTINAIGGEVTQTILNGTTLSNANTSGVPIYVAMEGGTNTINIQGSYADTPIVITGGGSDTVNLGNSAGSAQNLLGSIRIDNVPSFNILNINNSADTTGRNVTVDTYSAYDGPWGSIVGLTPGGVSYKFSDTHAITITNGSGNDVTSINATNGISPVTVDGYKGNDIVYAGASTGTLSGIASAVTVKHTGGSGTSWIDILDYNDTVARTVSVTASTIGAAGLPTFNYTPGQVSVIGFVADGLGNTFNVTGIGAGTLFNLSTGTGNDTVNVQAMQGSLAIYGQNGTDTVNIGSLAPALGGNVSAIGGSVSVANSSGSTALVVDDSGDTTARSAVITNSSISGLAPGTINYANLSSLTVLTGVGGGNSINVQSTSATTNIIGKSSGGGPDDSAVVGVGGSTQGIAAPLNFSNPPGFTLITIDDSTDATARTVVVANNSVSGISPAVISWVTNDTHAVTVYGGTGGNTFTVTGTNRSTTLNSGTGNDTVNVLATQNPLTIQGQGGADTVTIGSAAPALGGTVAAITGAVTVANAAGSTALVIDDDADTTVRNVVVTSSAITGLAPAAINYGSTLSSLTIYTGTVGGNSINVQSTSAPTNIIGKSPGAGPDDVVKVGVGGNTQGIAGPLSFSNPPGFDLITIDDSADPTSRTVVVTTNSVSGISPAAISWVPNDVHSVTVNGGTGGNTFTVNGTNRSTTLNTGTGNDTVNVQATLNPLTVQGQSGSDTVNIGSLAPALGGTVAAINGNVTVANAAGSTALVVDDELDTTPRNLTITNNAITGVAPAAINYANLSSLVVRTGFSGGNTINVPSSGTTTLIIGNSNGPNDTALVGAGGNLSGIAQPLIFSNPPGFTAITIDGSADAAAHTVALNNNSLTGMSPAPINWDPNYTASVTIKGGAGGNTYTVTGTPFNTTLNTGTGADKVNIQGTSGALTVQGQSGADVIVIGGIAPAIGGTVAGIFGTVTLANAAGSIALTVDDSADTTARSSIITSSSITGLSPAPINFANLLSLTVRTGSGGGNATNVQSNSVTTNIIGNSPAAGPDDSVLVGVGGKVSGLLAGLNISNPTGFTAITIEDSTDTTPRTATVNSGYVSGLTPKSITWAAANTRSVLINSGFAGNTFNIQSTLAPLTINAGTGSDAYNIGNTSNTLNGIAGNVLINGGAGTYVLGLIDLGSGTSNSYVLGATSISRNGIGVITYFGATNVHMLGGRGNDTYTLNATPAANMFLLDFGGNNKLVGPNVASAYSIVSANTVQVGSLYASNIQSLVGGTSNNYYRFLPGGKLTGSINGGVGGFNTIDESFVSKPVSVNLATSKITSVGSTFSNIQYVIGNSGVVSGGILTGPAAATNYLITGLDSGLAGGMNFSNFGNIVAGAGNDVFSFNTPGSLSGSIDGKGGTNSFDNSITTNLSNVIVNLATSNVNMIGGTFANITNFVGGGGFNTLIGTNAASTFSITGPDTGTVSGVTFGKFGNLIGGSANDIFKFAATGSISLGLDGGGGANSIDQSLYTTPISLNLATSTITGVGWSFANISGFSGGTGSNTLTGPNTGTVFSITGNRAGTVGTTTFAGYGSLVGGGGNDVFKLATVNGFLPGSINGGGGTDTMDYSALSIQTRVNLATSTSSLIAGGFSNVQVFIGSANATNSITGPVAGSTYNITALDAYNVNGLSFSGFGTINAGAGEDTFVVSDGAGLSGKLNGGTGANWLDYSAYTTGVTVNIVTGAATGFGLGSSGIRNVRGGNGNDSLTGNSSGNILIGGPGNDTLIGGSGRSILIGGTGVDTITGGSGDDILIGGSTTFDNNNAAFDAILAEWQSATDNYATRINFIKNGGGLNGTNVLNLGTTVIDDLAANVLTGGAGNDWFFKGINDNLTDRAAGEQVN